jgi:cysteine-rich repeat protein
VNVQISVWRIASSFVVVLVLAAPVCAQVCGNGILELGESCDDGNLVGGDCCSPTCVRAFAGQLCRLAVDPCDEPEVCDGVQGVCPPDTGIIGDSDGDGVCDPLDSCPADYDPTQLDRDLDGLGDVCDPCTNVAQIEVTKPRLRLRKLDQPFGGQRVKVRGELVVPASPPIDPVANGMRFVVTDGTGAVLLDITVPGGAYDPATHRGWTTNGSGVVYNYLDKEGSAGGIRRVLVKQRVPGSLRVVAFGQDGEFGLPASDAANIAIVADPPNGDTQCAEVHLGKDRCRFRNQGGKLLCH